MLLGKLVLKSEMITFIDKKAGTTIHSSLFESDFFPAFYEDYLLLLFGFLLFPFFTEKDRGCPANARKEKKSEDAV